MRDRIISTPYWLGVLFLVLCLLIHGRFDPWFTNVATGDDLGNFIAFYHHEFAGSLWQSLTGEYANHYRPFFQAAWWAMASLFGHDMKSFEVANIIINAVSGVFFFVTAFHVSRRDTGISLVITAAFVLSRFMLYQIITATGLMESLGLLFFIVSFWSALKAEDGYEQRPARYRWISALAIMAAVYTHERYVLIPAVYAIAQFVLPRARREKRGRLLLVAFLIAIPVSNFVINVFIFKSGFFVGPGGAPFNIGGSLQQIYEAITSIFGFNKGAPTFFGGSIWMLPRIFILFAAALPLCYLASLISLGLSEGRDSKSGRWASFAFFSAIFWALLLPPVSTFPLQPQWLVEPFALFLLWLATISPKAVAGTAAIASIVLGIGYTRIFDGIGWVAESRQTQQFTKAFIHGDLSGIGTLNIVARPDFCGWPLQQGRIFELYDHQARPLHCIADIAAAGQEPINPRSPIFYADASGGYHELDPGIDGMLTARISAAPEQIVASSLTPEQRQNGVPLWIKIAGEMNPDFVLTINGREMESAAGRNYMTTLLPASVLDTPGTYDLRIQAIRGGKVATSAPASLPIK